MASLPTEPTIVVSGLPRSGTSMAMQMVVAAGVPAFEDGHRPPDSSNPRGYLEHAAVRRLDRDPDALAAARGRVVKVVSPLLPYLPEAEAGGGYRVVFMRRELREVLRSQRAMLEALGNAGVAPADETLAAAFEKAEARARRVAASRPDVDWIEVEHADTLASPRDAARRLVAFVLGASPDAATIDRVAAVVDPALHRAR